MMVTMRVVMTILITKLVLITMTMTVEAEKTDETIRL